MLNNIESQLHPYNNTIDVKSLTTNFRSKGNVVEFNNRFFELAAKYEYENEKELCETKSAKQIMTAYNDVVQKTKKSEDHEGLVKVCLFDSEDYDIDMMKHIEHSIDDILNAGAKMGDIAILVRFNRHIPVIAEYFMSHRPDLILISDEAFRLNNSIAVRTIIKALSLISDGNNVLARTSLAVSYQKDILGRKNIPDSYIITISNDTSLSNSLLPEEFINNIDNILLFIIFTEFIISGQYFILKSCWRNLLRPFRPLHSIQQQRLSSQHWSSFRRRSQLQIPYKQALQHPIQWKAHQEWQNCYQG